MTNDLRMLWVEKAVRGIKAHTGNCNELGTQEEELR